MSIQKHIKNDWKNIGVLNNMIEINLIDLFMTLGCVIFGFVLGIIVGHYDR